MLQFFVIALVRLITGTFFRRIDVIGTENIPGEGPVIFAGNHPNALMDGWLLTARCGRWPLHFLANAKLWKYRGLGPLLDASGAIPVYRREEHEGEVDNQEAFDRVYEVIQSRHCMGIFPEGVSHAESKLVKLKTGTARIALEAAARGTEDLAIIPCGLNYIHRHRFRSQVLIEFGEPIEIDARWIRAYVDDQQNAVTSLTERIGEALSSVTLNAPDWGTLRFIQAVRRLYKPSSAKLTPGQYVELNRRFVEGYVAAMDDPDMQRMRRDVENYQARLDMLGLKDYQLRQPMTLSLAFRRVFYRSVMMMLLLPFAIPGALLHLPVGWLVALVGERCSYEMDDIATLKVFSTMLLLPLLYTIIAMIVGFSFGLWWALATLVALPFSFFASVRLLEAEAGLLTSMQSLLKLTRLGAEVDDLRTTRTELAAMVRDVVEQRADPDMPRMFAAGDFAVPDS
jgi:glycerol-3-phosphate O-acyltransferase/dihydroxyacetone phosphate acyltransferase